MTYVTTMRLVLNIGQYITSDSLGIENRIRVC